MNVHDEDDLYLYVCWAHTFGLCGSKNATSSCRGDWSVLSRKAEGAGGGQEDQGQCGCGYGCPKNLE